MSQPVLVLTRPLPVPPLTANGQAVEVRQFRGDQAVFAQAQVLLSTVMDPVDARLIDALPASIRLIANVGVGLDNIDLRAAAARGIAVSNTPVVTEDTADLAFLLILASARRLYSSESMVRSGRWNSTDMTVNLGTTVQGKTLGVVGFGAIGQAVARRARACNMAIAYHGPRPKPEAAAAVDAIYYPQLTAMLAAADIVTLHCPLSPATRHLIDAQTLAAMKPGAILVNTGRGALVDERALIDALHSGHLSGAGLDVFEREPTVPPQLLAMDNVTLTPHMGSATRECRGAMFDCALQNAIACFEGRPLLTPVDPG